MSAQLEQEAEIIVGRCVCWAEPSVEEPAMGLFTFGRVLERAEPVIVSTFGRLGSISGSRQPTSAFAFAARRSWISYLDHRCRAFGKLASERARVSRVSAHSYRGATKMSLTGGHAPLVISLSSWRKLTAELSAAQSEPSIWFH